MTSAEARFNTSLRPRKPEGSLGRTAQDVHLDSHTAPELCKKLFGRSIVLQSVLVKIQQYQHEQQKHTSVYAKYSRRTINIPKYKSKSLILCEKLASRHYKHGMLKGIGANQNRPAEKHSDRLRQRDREYQHKVHTRTTHFVH